MKLLMILLMGGSSVFAAQSRYSYRAKCYFVATNETMYSVQHFGRITGLSDFSCQNALDNLEEECDQIAKAAGYPAGNVYKDILIEVKEGSTSASRVETSSSENKRRGPFSINERSGKSYRSISTSQTEVSKTAAEYLQVDATKDCIIDRKFPQQNVPTIQNSRYGG